ncbi:MAG: O-antigen/teichoic acid export membrane protein [Maribacter sp.]|jgi:O-antigen/teichoic acid export membrane protein
MLPLVIRFFLLPVYLLVLDVDDYGMLAIIYIFGSFFEIFGNLRLETAVQTYYYDYVSQPEKLKAYISNIFTASLLISFSLLAFLILLSPTILDWILKSNDLSFFPDVLIILCTSFLLINLRIYYAYIKNKKSFFEFVGYSLASLLLNTGFQLFFLFPMNMGITGVLLGNLVGTSFVFSYFIINHINLISFNLKWGFIRPSLGYSVTFIPFLIFFRVNQRIDRFFIEHFLGWEWLGKFAVLLALTNLIRIVITSANTSFRPFLFEYFSEGAKKK